MKATSPKRLASFRMLLGVVTAAMLVTTYAAAASTVTATLSSALSVTWSINASVVRSSMTVSSSYSGAFSMNGQGDMGGVGVCCYATPGVLSSARCIDINTYNFNVARSGTQTELLSATSSGGWTTFVFATPARRLGVVPGSSMRTLLSYQPYNLAANLPREHGDDVPKKFTVTMPTDTHPVAPPATQPTPHDASITVDLAPIFTTPAFVVSFTLNATHLTTNLTIAAPYAGSFGFCDSGMVGPMVSCFPASGANAATCVDLVGYNFGVQRAPGAQQTRLVRYWENSVDSTRHFLAVTPITRFGSLTINETRRLIFAYTGWTTTSGGLPVQHASGAYSAQQVTFSQTTPPPAPSASGWVELVSSTAPWASVALRVNATTSALTFNLTVTNGRCIAAGFSSAGMVGPIVACYASASGAMAARCRDLDGSNYGISLAAQQPSTLISSSVGASTTTFLVTTPMARMGVSATGTYRFIIAYMDYDAANNIPLPHTTTARTVWSLTMPSANSSAPPPPPPTTAPLPPTPAPPVTLPPTNTSGPILISVFTDPVVSAQLSSPSNSSASCATTNWMDVDLSVDSGYAISMLFAPVRMTGRGVTCYGGAGVATPLCVDIAGYDYGIAHAAPAGLGNETQLLSVTMSSTTTPPVTVATFHLRLFLPVFGCNCTQHDVRVAFAFTQFDSVASLPLPHAPPTSMPAAAVHRQLRPLALQGTYRVFLVSLPGANGTFSSSPPAPSPPPATLPTAPPSPPGTHALMTIFPGVFSLGTFVSSAAGTIDFTLEFSASAVVAFGQSGTGMSGPAVACYVDSSVFPSSTVRCVDIDGFNYGVTAAASSHSSVTSSAVSASGTATCVVSVPLSRLGLSVGSMTRFIFTYSSAFDTVYSVPSPHSPGVHVAAALIVVEGSQSTLSTIASVYSSRSVAYAIIGGASASVVAVGAVATALQRMPYLWPRQVLELKVAACLAVVAAVIGIVAAANHDFVESARAIPLGRALGEGTAFLFACVLFPTTRTFGLFRLFDSAPERTTWLHMVFGVFLFVCATVHFAWMVANSAAPFSELMSTKTSAKNLSGFLAWLCLAILSLPALFARRQSFGLFRVTHLLFPAALFLAWLHYPRLGVMILPGCCLWFLDALHRLYKGVVASRAVVESLEYHPSADHTIILRVRWAVCSRPPAASYAYLWIPRLSFMLHPFTIAASSHREQHSSGAESSTYLVTFAIKAQESRWSWTGRLAALAAATASGGGGREVMPFLLCIGPFGSLQVPLFSEAQQDTAPSAPANIPATVALLVGGGIGVTPALSIADAWLNPEEAGRKTLRQFGFGEIPQLPGGDAAVTATTTGTTHLDHMVMFSGPPKPPVRVNLVIVSRSLEFLHLIEREFLQRLVLSSGCSGGGNGLTVKLFCTCRPTTSPLNPRHHHQQQQQQRWEQQHEIVFSRPDFDREIDEVQQRLVGNERRSLAVYVCGPEPLMDSVVDAAQRRHVRVHQETFSS